MKYKIFIFIIILFTISGCSFVNEKKIEESENIDVKTFLDSETKTGILTDNNSKTSSGILIDNNNESSTGQSIEEEIEAQKIEEDIKKLIDILFEE